MLARPLRCLSLQLRALAAMQYHFGNFIYFFVLLSGATLAYSWNTVIAVGTWTSALWIVGMVWVWWQPDRDPALTARIAAAIGSDHRLFQLISPNSIVFSARIHEIVVFMIVAVTLAVAVRRGNDLLIRHAAVERERGNLARYFSPNVVEELSRNDEPLKQVRTQNVAVLFVDIVGFTRLCRRAHTGRSCAHFASRDDVLQFIESYAAFIHAPLRCGLAATALRQTPDSKRLIVETTANLFEAKNVVIATGPFHVPVDPLPVGGAALHLHSSQYRNPQRLPPGAVLVIGSGNSGHQIAEELCSAGRRVYLSVSKHRRMPRRYRGKDYIWWHFVLGEADTTVDQRRGAQPPRLFTGVRGGYDVDLRRLAADGVVLLGRVLGGQGSRLTIARDLGENLARGDTSPLSSSCSKLMSTPVGKGWTFHLPIRVPKSYATRRKSPIPS